MTWEDDGRDSLSCAFLLRQPSTCTGGARDREARAGQCEKRPRMCNSRDHRCHHGCPTAVAPPGRRRDGPCEKDHRCRDLCLEVGEELALLGATAAESGESGDFGDGASCAASPGRSGPAAARRRCRVRLALTSLCSSTTWFVPRGNDDRA
jgi:hypothetical protein